MRVVLPCAPRNGRGRFSAHDPVECQHESSVRRSTVGKRSPLQILLLQRSTACRRSPRHGSVSNCSPDGVGGRAKPAKRQKPKHESAEELPTNRITKPLMRPESPARLLVQDSRKWEGAFVVVMPGMPALALVFVEQQVRYPLVDGEAATGLGADERPLLQRHLLAGAGWRHRLTQKPTLRDDL